MILHNESNVKVTICSVWAMWPVGTYSNRTVWRHCYINDEDWGYVRVMTKEMVYKTGDVYENQHP
jgi:hypothetical protein